MPPKNPAVADVENRFKFHPATETTGPKHDQVRTTLLRVAKQLQRDLPDGREKSLVLTKLEEAMFWANAAIARQPAESSDAPAPQPAAEKPAAKKTATPGPDLERKEKAAAKKTTRRVTRRATS